MGSHIIDCKLLMQQSEPLSAELDILISCEPQVELVEVATESAKCRMSQRRRVLLAPKGDIVQDECYVEI